MSNYRRSFAPGGTFFFTVVTAERSRILSTPNGLRMLRQAVAETKSRWPFYIDAMVVLPDHVHAIWILPADDHDFSTRWAFLKKSFTKAWLESGGTPKAVGAPKATARRADVWQRRFWEHTIRDDRDFERHCDYIHYNPVKHGVAACPHSWAASSFTKWVRMGVYDPDWCCACDGRKNSTPSFDDLVASAAE